MSLFVIPGLIRNPVLFQSVKVLDAGSSPAWQAEFKRFFELRHSLAGENPGVFELDSCPHLHGSRLCAGV